MQQPLLGEILLAIPSMPENEPGFSRMRRFAQLDPGDRQFVGLILDGLLVKREVRRLAASLDG